MEEASFSALILFVILLGLSAFFSGSETAYFSLSELNLSKLRDEKRASSRRIIRLIKESRRLLITIITGNTIVNVAAASIAAFLAITVGQKFGLSHNLIISLEVVVVTFVILVLSEVTPKIIAVRNPVQIARLTAIPLYFFFYLLWPITFLLTNFVQLLTRLIKGKDEKDTVLTANELKVLLDIGEERGELEAEEKEMIHSIFEFSETQVREVMVPRIDMVCVPHAIKLSKLIQVIKECGHTRIPVFQDTVDNICGIINAKELLPHVKNHDEEINLLKLARPPYFVPESKKIDELLREFQNAKTHMAIVVDEYGGTAGLITLEDVIEEIVGEIQDEYDQEAPLIRPLDENTWVSNAKISIYELNEILGIELPEEEGYESLGGFIMHQTGNVPSKDVSIDHGGFRFVVEEVKRNRIVKVRITKLAQKVTANA